MCLALILVLGSFGVTVLPHILRRTFFLRSWYCSTYFLSLLCRIIRVSGIAYKRFVSWTFCYCRKMGIHSWKLFHFRKSNKTPRITHVTNIWFLLKKLHKLLLLFLLFMKKVDAFPLVLLHCLFDASIFFAFIFAMFLWKLRTACFNPTNCVSIKVSVNTAWSVPLLPTRPTLSPNLWDSFVPLGMPLHCLAGFELHPELIACNQTNSMLQATNLPNIFVPHQTKCARIFFYSPQFELECALKWML